jgi:TonB-linked SusC/RagA family outer membrane protein
MMRNFNLMSLRLLVLLAVMAIGLSLSAQHVAPSMTIAPPAVNAGGASVTAAPQSGKIVVTGRVTDKNGEPLIGASVTAGDQGTATDIDGNYSISLKGPATLSYRYVGYSSQEIKITGSCTRDVVLDEDGVLLNEMVVVGYGTQKRINLTGAVSTVDVAKQLEARPITDIARGLQGAAPGLTVRTATGELGTDPTIKIRGIIGSVNGDSSPLILVDNVECNSLQNINPDDVENISVLKDAASASIYGVKAAFGVVLITTKQAKKGDKVKITYTDNFSWRRPTVTPEIVKTYEGAQMSWDAGLRQNPNLSEQVNSCYLTWNLESIERMKEWDRVYGGMNLSNELVLGRDFEIMDGKLYFYRSFDGADMFMKKNAFQQSHNLNISGSAGNTTYNVGLGYLGQDGIMKVNTDSYKRYNVSANTSTSLGKYIDVRTKFLYTRYKLEDPYYFGPSSYYDEWYYLYRWPKIMPYGTYQGIPFRNAVTEIQQANRNEKTNNYFRVSLGTTIHIVKGLDFEGDYTFTHVNRYIRTNGGYAEGWNFWGGAGLRNEIWTLTSHDKVINQTQNSDFHVFNGLFRYNTTFNEAHEFGAILGLNLEHYTEYGNTAERRGVLLVDHTELPLAFGEQYSNSQHNHWARTGYFARLNYAYKSRYLLELNGRYDGSSRFPQDKLWGFFPSMSAGWVISEESFMESLKPTLSLWKIRGSWGQIGNQDVAQYEFLPLLTPTTYNWIINDTKVNSFGLPKALKNGFTWETITTTDIGTDIRFFSNRLGISFDWFKRVNSDMITAGEALPATFGQSAPRENFGELTTNGWEISLDFHHHFNFGLGLNLTAYLSDAKIKYTKIPSTSRIITDVYEGKEYGEIWGYETDRLFQIDDFDVDPSGKYVLKEGIPSQAYFETDGWFFFGPGDVKYKDLNGDGVINPGNSTIDNHGDLKRIGNSCPRYEYGIRLDMDYKGIDLGIFLQGVGKRDYWGSGSIVIPGFNYLEAWYTHQLDYWTPENTDAFYPRLTNNGQSNNARNFLRQSRYLLDMSYCRVKNVTLGYTFPENWMRKIHLQKLRVYLSLENLFEFDHMGDVPIDPETQYKTGDGDYLGRSYPYSRTTSFGVQVTF